MMKFLRKKGVMKILLWGIAIVVILSFGILSNAYLLNERSSSLKYAGRVFGRKISLEVFQRNYQFVTVMAFLQYGDNVHDIVPYLNLPEQTWERILLLEEARRQRISILDRDVVETISSIPLFQNRNTNQFDKNIYQMILTRQLRITPKDFERGMRERLMIVRLFESQTQGVTVTEDELAEAYQTANEQVRVSYVLFPARDFTRAVEFSEIQAKSYFMDNKKQFIQPPAVNAGYMRFAFDSDDPETGHRAYEQAVTALNALNDGQHFLSVAAAQNAQLNETGFFPIDEPNLALGWPAETFRSLFSMRQGQHTSIITTPGSYDIIQLREIRPPFVPGYEDIKEEVHAAWTRSEAMGLAQAKAKEHLNLFQQEGSFKESAAEQGLAVEQTPDFSRGQYLPALGLAQDFQEAAFSLTDDHPLSGVVPVENGYAILHLDAYLPIDPEGYEEGKEEFRTELLERKRSFIFNMYFQELREKAQIEDLISQHLN